MQKINTSEILFALGVVTPFIFIAVCIFGGNVIAGYDARTDFISFMMVGEMAWIEKTNEIVCGLLFMLFGLGVLRFGDRRSGMLVLGAGAAGFLSAASPTSADIWVGMSHRIFAGVFFILVFWLMWESATKAKNAKWRLFSAISLVVIVCAILWAVIFYVDFKGVLQRVSVFTMQIWLSAFAAKYLLTSLKKRKALAQEP